MGFLNFMVGALGTAVKATNPKVQEAVKKAKKMSNAELAKWIRSESDVQTRTFLEDEFFGRGNTKKDLYNY